MITRLFSEENIYALGWTVLHSLWQAFLIALIMGLIMLFLQKRSAQTRYWLANAALLSVFLFSLITFFTLKPATNAAEPMIAIFMAPEAVAEMPEEAGSVIETFWSQFLLYFNTHLPIVVTIWLAGMAFFILRMLGGLLYLQRLRQHAEEVSIMWQKKMNEIADALAVSRPVKLLESALVNTPMAIGVLKPVILLPIGAINGLSAGEVEAILAHELAHIRRHDYLLNIFQSIIEVLYYFNPAVWWISANVRLERENCCDDLAVAFCGNSLIYAKALVKVEELSQRAPAFAMAFSSGKHHMLNRVKRILNQSENRSNMMEKLTATLLLLMAVALFSISANQPMDQPTEAMIETTLPDAENLEWQALREIKEAYPTLEPARLSSFSKKLTALPRLIMEAVARPDTLPYGKTTLNLTRKNGQKVEAKIRDGEINYLKVDGREIPPSEYARYEDMLEEILTQEIPTPPTPPRPPVPPAPVAPGAAPTPPTPPSAPAPPSFRGKTKVKTKKDKDGNTVITIESSGDEPMEFRFDENDNRFFMNGDVLEDGETIIIETDRPFFDGHFAPLDEIREVHGALANVHLLNEFIDSAEMSAHLAEMKMELENVQLYEQQIRMEEMAQLRAMMEKERRVLKRQLENSEGKERLRMEKEVREQLKHIELQEHEIRKQLEEELRQQERHLAPMLSHGYGNGKMQSLLERELVADQLIQNTEKYELELSAKTLRVDGKKQSNALHEKYLEIYRKVAGNSLEGKSKLVIDKSNRK